MIGALAIGTIFLAVAGDEKNGVEPDGKAVKDAFLRAYYLGSTGHFLDVLEEFDRPRRVEVFEDLLEKVGSQLPETPWARTGMQRLLFYRGDPVHRFVLRLITDVWDVGVIGAEDVETYSDLVMLGRIGFCKDAKLANELNKQDKFRHWSIPEMKELRPDDASINIGIPDFDIGIPNIIPVDQKYDLWPWAKGGGSSVIGDIRWYPWLNQNNGAVMWLLHFIFDPQWTGTIQFKSRPRKTIDYTGKVLFSRPGLSCPEIHITGQFDFAGDRERSLKAERRTFNFHADPSRDALYEVVMKRLQNVAEELA
jgi:hypothetical protein